ncbi:MAG: ORF6N domain-containing protein [Bacteroidota bacterium]
MNNANQISEDLILTKIHFIRGQKVMLDKDLAELYNVQTKVFNQAVKRNTERFPADFAFRLSEEEFEILRSQFVTSSWGGVRYLPMAFTEQGVAMLSSILNSDLAIKVNIQIIRIFTRMREMLSTHKDILLKLEEIEKKVNSHDQEIQVIFEYLKQLLNPPNTPRRRIGFKGGDEIAG